MQVKLGRNDSCWSGSKIKYKKCHLDRDNMPALSKQHVLTELSESRSKKYCLHPKASEANCKGGIVKAHTIQRSGGLSKIAEKGHVMRLNLDMSSPPTNPTLLMPKLIGVRMASHLKAAGKKDWGAPRVPCESHSRCFYNIRKSRRC